MDLRGIFVGLLLCGVVLTVHGQAISVRYDGDSLIEIGTDVVLPISFDLPTPSSDPANLVSSFWRREGSYRKKFGKGYFDTNRTFVYSDAPKNLKIDSHSLADGIVSILVESVSLEDAATYEVELEDEALRIMGSTTFPISVYSNPTVYVEDVEVSLDIRPPPPAPEPGTESSNMTANVTSIEEETTAVPEADEEEDAEVTVVKCLVVNSYPTPHLITFTDGSAKTWEQLPEEFENTLVENDDGTVNVTASLRISPTADLDKAVITCSASITSEDRIIASENESSPIQVKYLTSMVEVDISPSSTVNEQTPVTISCLSDGNPAPKKILTLPNGDALDVSEGGHTFHARRESTGEYKCTASNNDDVDSFENVETLTVTWMNAPTIEAPSVAREGKPVTLTCRADSERNTVTYTWTKNGNFVSSGRTLVINNAEATDEGEYQCEASGASVLIASHTLKVEVGCVPEFQEPIISSSSVKQGTSFVKVTCIAKGNPKCDMTLSHPEGVKPTIEKNMAQFEILSYEKQMKKPTIKCVASNNFSTNSVEIMLDNKDICCVQPQSGGLSTGVIIIIIIIVALLVVGIPLGCYLAKKRNASKGDSSKSEKNIDDVEADKLNPTPAEDGL